MMTKSLIKQNAYYDSIVFMTIMTELRRLPGVFDAAVVTGTEANKSRRVSN